MVTSVPRVSALQVGAKMLTACQRLQRNVAAATAGGSTPQIALTEYNVYAAACVRSHSLLELVRRESR